MATLTAPQLQDIRNLLESCPTPITTADKTAINGAIQAIETAMTGATNVGARTVQAFIAQAIEASAPGIFTNAQKQVIFALWCVRFATRTGVL